MKKSTLYLILCVSLALTLFCGCQNTKTAATPTPANTSVPTGTPTPTNTPVPTVTPTPTLSPTPTSTPTPTPSPTPTSTPTPTPSPTPVVTTLTVSCAGDVTLGSDLINQNRVRNFYVKYDQVQDDAYFFAGVLPYFSADDLTLVNLEGVLSDRGERQDKTYAFRGPSSYVNILLEGSIEAVCMANNHSSDYGKISHEDTKEILSNAGICYSVDDIVSYTTIKDIKVAMISIYTLRRDLNTNKALLDTAIAEAKAEQAQLIITSFHWGIERDNDITDLQHDLAHYAVDSGSNLVLGHHPHVLQPIEKYKDSYIVYSLANFCFGGNTNPSDKDTILYQQTFTFVDGALTPDDTVRVIPCSISSVKTPNDYQPTPQSGKEAERIINRIIDYSTPYGLTFEASEDGIYVPAALPDTAE